MEWFEIPRRRWLNDSNNYPGDERDNQRQRCYDAEFEVREECNFNRFESVEEIQEYINKICSKKWFRRRWGRQHIVVLPGQRRRKACGSYLGNYIKLPLWARTEIVILHELAHAIVPNSYGAGHGRYWARSFLELVRLAVGETEYKLLREKFKKYNVKYCPKRILSASAKQVLRERFIKNVLKKEENVSTGY